MGAQKSKQYVSDLAEGERVDSAFVVRSREMRAARTGEAYLTLELADRTGRIGAVLFRPDARAAAVPTGAVVRASGRVTSFRGVRRLSLETLTGCDSWERSDMIASSARPRTECVTELRELVRSVSHSGLRAVLNRVFGDAVFFSRFKDCPGSQTHHHAYLGGLLEHTVQVARQAAQAAGTYPGVDADLLVSAALLHDVGKVEELAFDTSIEYTDEGRLLGHVVLGARRIRNATEATKLEPSLAVRLEHAVLSHHGELEWGSPKRPSTIEALLLHHIDNMDAKAAGFVEALQGASVLDEAWTDSYNLFRRPLFAPRPAEDDRPDLPSEDAAYRRASA